MKTLSSLRVSYFLYTDDTENTGSSLHEMHYHGFFARDISDMGYQPGGEIMASLLPVGTHMQKLAY